MQKASNCTQMQNIRQGRQIRSIASDFQTREDSGDLYIEGYFAVFGSRYELWEGAAETIQPGAFTDTLAANDIRALVDHQTHLVLGRIKAGTLELKEDEHGLYGRIKVNRDDVDAMNLYARIQRGDVDQCSFGFNILAEEYREDPVTHEVLWTLIKLDVFEVSVVTFPAYEETTVAARNRDYHEIQRRKKAAWKNTMHKKISGGTKNGIESADASQDD